jgi:hypothetical protein
MNAISTNAHRPLDVDPQLAAIALDRLDPLRPFRDGLAALGLDQRVAIGPIHTKAGASTGSVSVGIPWSLPGGSRAELTWTASVDPFAENRSLVPSSVQAGANDADGRQRLLEYVRKGGPSRRASRRLQAGEKQPCAGRAGARRPNARCMQRRSSPRERQRPVGTTRRATAHVTAPFDGGGTVTGAPCQPEVRESLRFRGIRSGPLRL